jgi:hypothetical protein
MSDKRFHIVCPGCNGQLVIDAATGEIISHKKAKEPIAGGKNLEGLFQEMRDSRSRAESVFEKEKAAMKDRDRLLAEKFEEAMKRAEEEDDGLPPPRPFDLD